MKNTIGDLNNYLFESLERLMQDDLSEDDMQKEIRRSEAVTKVAGTVIHNAELSFKVMQHMNEYRQDGKLAPLPTMLQAGDK